MRYGRTTTHADVKCDFTYIHYQADFNNQVFSKIRTQMSNRLVEKGAAFVDEAHKIDVLVPAE